MLSLNLSNKAIQDFFFLLEIVREEKGIKKSVIGAPAQKFQLFIKMQCHCLERYTGTPTVIGSVHFSKCIQNFI